jgi:transketolase
VPGKADWLRKGNKAAILTFGPQVQHAVKAREELANQHGLEVAVLNFASIKPLDIEAIEEAAKTGLLITAEDHHVDTGLGARVASVLAEKALPCRLVRLGVKKYGLSGKPDDLYRLEGINWEGIVKTVLQNLTSGQAKK